MSKRKREPESCEPESCEPESCEPESCEPESCELESCESNTEKKIHNLLYAKSVKEFFNTHDTSDQNCVAVHLDAGGAQTTIALSKVLNPTEMKKVCANTKKRKTYAIMERTIEKNKIECFVEREDIKRKFCETIGLDNKGKPMCVYLDICSTWKPQIKEIVDNIFRWYCFDGSSFAITVCLTHRCKEYPHDPKIVLKEIKRLAKKHNRKLEIKYQKKYGKMNMFFVQFQVF